MGREQNRNPAHGSHAPLRRKRGIRTSPHGGHGTAPYAPSGMPKEKGATLCQRNPLKFMVGRARFERATLCLKGRYSTY